MDTTTMMRRRNLRVTEQLLGELEAKRFDSALTARILSAPSAFPRLLRACFLAQDRQLAAARADVEAALTHANPNSSTPGSGLKANPVVGLVAGMISFVTRDYARALALLDDVARSATGSVARLARQQSIQIAAGLGWDHDARASIEAAIAAEPEQPSWHGHAVRLFARARHWRPALEHALRAIELAPTHASMWMEVAGLHARVGQANQAIEAVERALQLARTEPETERIYQREGVRVAIDAGAFDLATTYLDRAIALEPEAGDLHVLRAELHSWHGAAAKAAIAIEQATACAPQLPAVLRLRGAQAALDDRHADAVAPLEQAIAGDPSDYQAHLWLAETYLRLGRLAEAHAQLHHATAHADGFLFIAWLLRFLVVEAERRAPDEILTRNRTEEFELALIELCPEPAKRALASMRSGDLVEAVEAAITALRGNRSVYPTHVVDGVLTRVRARTGCRHESRWALQLLRVASGDECRATFTELVARYPGSSLPLCHRGELNLWLGDYAAAEADLEAAIATVEGTRWAYMGLSTLALIAGDPERCLALNARGVEVMQGSEGPAIHVYRGEAMRLLGQLGPAIAELERAVERHPARVSATINLALAYRAAGERAGFDRLWHRLADEQASGLLSDAAAELGLAIYGDPNWEPSDAIKIAVLERSLELLRGNRSSSLVSYWTGSRLRFVPVWPSAADGTHARDHQHLEQAKRLLLEALTRYQGPRR